eukprot:g10747.t1
MAAAAAAETALTLTVQSGLLVSWTEAAELQRASLALCATCRRCIPVRVRVAATTPRRVWSCGSTGGGLRGGDSATGDKCDRIGLETKQATKRRWQQQQQQQRQRRQQHHHHRQQQQAVKVGSRGGGGVDGNRSNGGTEGARLPRLQILSMLWEAPASHLGDGGDLPSGLRELTFGRDFNRTLSGLVWPPRLERLTLGSKFNRDLVQSKERSGERSGVGRAATGGAAGGGVVDQEERSETAGLCLLPWSLKELTLGKQFNKPLPRTLLPPGLVSLTLGRNFRHRSSVRDVVWPVGIKVVRFGEAMLKRERRDWPWLEAMRGLTPSSNHPGETAASFAWPAGLERVEFWHEGRAVVSLKGGKTLEGDSLEWLTNH